MFRTNIIKSIKSLFIKEETFSCIIWNTKTMSYMNLTQEQIDFIRNDEEHKGWSVTINEEKIG